MKERLDDRSSKPKLTPTIDLYAICWNEGPMLDFFFRHYDPIVSRYVMFDDGSTDGTLERIKAHPKVDVRPFVRSDQDSVIRSMTELQNRAWKESRHQCDWAIITAIDEHLYHRDLIEYLRQCGTSGVTAVPALGYQMVSHEFPDMGSMLANKLTRGAASRLMNKLSLFDPNAVDETNYGPGRHVAAPKGRIVYPDRDELMLLHYKFLDTTYVRGRDSVLAQRIGKVDRMNQWGTHYDRSDSVLRQEMADYVSRAIDVSVVGPRHDRLNSEKRWWRRRRRYWRWLLSLVEKLRIGLAGIKVQ